MFAVSGLAAILFLGGWNGPLPLTHWLGLTHHVHPLAGYVGNLLGMCNFIFKAFAGVVFMMWLRWTLPRLRIDQVMTTCLKYCIPLAAAMFVGAMLWIYRFPEGVFARGPAALDSGRAEQRAEPVGPMANLPGFRQVGNLPHQPQSISGVSPARVSSSFSSAEAR
jgi:hypothetical protein